MKNELKLTAVGATEQRILDYLNENASEVLAAKINAGNKTLAGAVKYATAEAKKLADGGNCVCVDDATVFGWIVHFFEEDEIAEPKKAPTKGVRAPSGVKNAKPAKPAEPEKQKGPIILELFSSAEFQGMKR